MNFESRKEEWSTPDKVRIPILIAALPGLFIVSFYVPFQGTWFIHFLFVFALTTLIYRDVLKTRHVRLYLVGLVVLMVAWEVFEWVWGRKICDSVFLTGLDTFCDSVFGLLGAMAAIKWGWRPT